MDSRDDENELIRQLTEQNRQQAARIQQLEGELERLKGQVPPPPDRLKDDTVASATRSRSVGRWTCSAGILCSIEHVLSVTPRTFSS
jgi:ABC-type Fe2+-enterobactin transport system substrate-binding protein